MRSNTYQNNAYQRRSPSRKPVPNQPAFGKRLIEEFLTQLTICILVTGVIFGAQVLRLPNISKSVDKVKTIITYSPSLKEIVQEAKEGTSALVEKISSRDAKVNDQEGNTQEIPIIIVDDEIF